MILARTVLIAWICNICVKAGYFPPDPPIIPPACYPTCSADRYCKEGTCVCTSGNEHLGKCVECVFPRVYKSCPTSCPRSCDDDPNTPIFCTKECDLSRYCVCAEGYVEKSKIDNTCVKKEECPLYCKPPSIRISCIPDCKGTCEHPKGKPGCSNRCMFAIGCGCPLGYVAKSETDPTCVKLEDCPNSCFLKFCPPGTVCRNGKCIDPCIFTTCPVGTTCKNGICIGVCKKPKEYNGCPTNCPITCDNINDPPGICQAVCRPGVKCVCPKGYVEKSSSDSTCVEISECRDSCFLKFCPPGTVCRNGKCIDPCIFTTCPVGTTCKNGICIDICRKPKEYNGCPTNCPKTCENFNDPPGICQAVCRPGVKCVCPKGYVERSSSDSTCVKTSDCVPTCQLPKDPGPCEALMPRFYFNAKSGTCQKFYYGGCKGNANRFDTKEECEKSCSVCKLNKDYGPCEAAMPRYFYNTNTGDCEKFYYGGCEGNANRFSSLAQCRKKCVDPCIRKFCPFGTFCRNGMCLKICGAGYCGPNGACLYDKCYCLNAASRDCTIY